MSVSVELLIAAFAVLVSGASLFLSRKTDNRAARADYVSELVARLEACEEKCNACEQQHKELKSENLDLMRKLFAAEKKK